MKEVKDAAKDGRLVEAFGAGTAAVVTPISCIEYKGEEIVIPSTGDATLKVWDQLTGIQYGKIEHSWSVKV
jgi:branched-chain amino acid aminotransferase